LLFLPGSVSEPMSLSLFCTIGRLSRFGMKEGRRDERQKDNSLVRWDWAETGRGRNEMRND
jgi:hypothetical protein